MSKHSTVVHGFSMNLNCCIHILIIIIIKSNSEVFQLLGLNRLKLSQKDNKIMFIMLYKHYLPKKVELKKPTLKLKFEI